MTIETNLEIIRDTTLTPLQQAAIFNLVQTKSIKDAATLTGVDRRTIHRWLNEATFLAELNQVQSGMWQEVNLRLSSLQGKVLDKLESLMSSEDEIISLKAADTLSNFLLKFYELSQVSSKLQEIERIMTSGD